MSDDKNPEAIMAEAIFGLADLRAVCHGWLDEILDGLAKAGKLSASAQVILTPEGCEGTSEIAVLMGLTFMPLDRGQPVVEPVMPVRGGVVH